MPKISIIIPVYNAEPYLSKSIHSCMAQTFKDIEIICVNDGSKDNSQKIIEEFASKDNRIHFIVQKNSGALIARKKGIEQATSEYCMFLDADDYYELNACEKAYEAITKHNVDIVQFSSYRRNLEDEIIKKPFKQGNLKKMTGQEALYYFLMDYQKYGLFLWDKIYRTELCQETLSKIQDMSLIRSNDVYHISILCMNAQSYIGIPDILYNHIPSVGFTNNFNITKFAQANQSIKTVLSLLQDLFKQHNVSEKFLEPCKKLEFLETNYMIDCYTLLDPSHRQQGLNILIDRWLPRNLILIMGYKLYVITRNFETINKQFTDIRDKWRYKIFFLIPNRICLFFTYWRLYGIKITLQKTIAFFRKKISNIKISK